MLSLHLNSARNKGKLGMSFLKKFQPKKIITCTNCGKRFQFPVKPGKTLNVTCPKCRSSYRVSFVNPVVELLKGRMTWRDLGPAEKKRMVIFSLIFLVCLGLIVSSLSRPIKPTTSQGIERAI